MSEPPPLLRHPSFDVIDKLASISMRDSSITLTNWPHPAYEEVVICDDIKVDNAGRNDYPGDFFLLMPRGSAHTQIQPDGVTGLMQFQHACGKTLSVRFTTVRCDENHNDVMYKFLDFDGWRDRDESTQLGRVDTADMHYVKIALASEMYYGADASNENQLGQWEGDAPLWIEDFKEEGWLTNAWQDPRWTRLFKPLWGMTLRMAQHRYTASELLWMWSEEKTDCAVYYKRFCYELQRRDVAEKVLYALASDDVFNDVSARQAVLNAFKAAFPTLKSTEPTMPPGAAFQMIESILAAAPGGKDVKAATRKYASH